MNINLYTYIYLTVFQVSGIFNNLKFVIRIKKETGCHQLIDENYHPKYFILSPGALLGM